MKRFSVFVLSLALSACLASHARAQAILVNTTLSAALGTGVTGQVATVTSATGITAPSASDPTKATYLVIDAELAQVVSVAGTQITLARGIGGTQARAHASGALVLAVPAYLATYFTTPPPTGSCTRTNLSALPIVSVSAGVAIVSDCLGGQWVQGDAGQTTRATQYRIASPTIGAVAYTSALGTSTAATAAELYCTEVDLPYSKLITGLAFHIGATGGTDHWQAGLYDSGGNLIANSATSAAVVGSPDAFEPLPLTVPYYAVGPAQYYACVMSNGTTATLDLITTGTDDLVLTYKSGSAGTYGTFPSFTPPTSFTTLKGAFTYVY